MGERVDLRVMRRIFLRDLERFRVGERDLRRIVLRERVLRRIFLDRLLLRERLRAFIIDFPSLPLAFTMFPVIGLRT